MSNLDLFAGNVAGPDRRGFLVGILVFTASSVLCAAADDLGWLVGARRGQE
jgi:hypothetical protein